MTAEDKTGLVAQIRQLEREVFDALHPIGPAEWLQTDLTMPQLKVLLILFKDEPARMSALAQRLGITLATTTGVVDRLVERGFVRRAGQPDDRRVVICRLSEEGHALVARLWELGPGRVERLLEAMTSEELAIVAQALEITLSAARRAHLTSATA